MIPESDKKIIEETIAAKTIGTDGEGRLIVEDDTFEAINNKLNSGYEEGKILNGLFERTYGRKPTSADTTGAGPVS